LNGSTLTVTSSMNLDKNQKYTFSKSEIKGLKHEKIQLMVAQTKEVHHEYENRID
jgi:hypothetical protein